MKCIIVDDEELARELLRTFCNKIPSLEVVAICSNATDAKTVLQRENIDLMLLDIQMPDMTGIELVQSLESKPLVIFSTAYSEFAQQGFELDVTDYLLKPFSFDRFQKAIDKAQEWYDFSHSPNEETITKSDKDYIVVKSEHKMYRIAYKDINYIQSLREYVAFYTDVGKTMSLGSLKKLEEDLPSDAFIRVHKSYIIAKDKAFALEGNIIHLDKEQIPIGPSYKEEVLRELF